MGDAFVPHTFCLIKWGWHVCVLGCPFFCLPDFEVESRHGSVWQRKDGAKQQQLSVWQVDGSELQPRRRHYRRLYHQLPVGKVPYSIPGAFPGTVDPVTSRLLSLYLGARICTCNVGFSLLLLFLLWLCSQAAGERNYHVFYQLLAGSAVHPELKERLRLKDPEEYHYLNQSGVTTVENINDLKDYEELINAMTVLNMSEVEREDILSLVSAILHLGTPIVWMSASHISCQFCICMCKCACACDCACPCACESACDTCRLENFRRCRCRFRMRGRTGLSTCSRSARRRCRV